LAETGGIEEGEGTMAAGPTLSVTALFAERDALRQRDKEAEEQLQRRKEEELVEFRKRLDTWTRRPRPHAAMSK
jgi:hypothetical protein